MAVSFGNLNLSVFFRCNNKHHCSFLSGACHGE